MPGRGRAVIPPCGRGSPGNRRRGVGSRFLRCVFVEPVFCRATDWKIMVNGLTGQAALSSLIEAFRMDGVQSNEAGSSLVSITVLSVTPMRAGRLFALASVEIDIDGVRIEVLIERGLAKRRFTVPTSD